MLSREGTGQVECPFRRLREIGRVKDGLYWQHGSTPQRALFHPHATLWKANGVPNEEKGKKGLKQYQHFTPGS
jgi:hypothetical protein